MNRAALNRKLASIGFSPRHKGFYHIGNILSALEKGCAENGREEYVRIVRAMSNGRPNVERNIRYATEYAWEIEKGRIRSLFSGIPSPMELVLCLHWEFECREEDLNRA